MKRYYQYLETDLCYYMKLVYAIGENKYYEFEYWSRKKNFDTEGLIELVAIWKVKIKI